MLKIAIPSFFFQISFSSTYPDRAPRLSCHTRIYHPNIDPLGDDNNVCISIISDWTSTNTLEDIIQGILFLFYHPNIEDPLSDFVPSDTEQHVFENNIAAIQKGENPLDEELELREGYFREAAVTFQSLGKDGWEQNTQKTIDEWEEKIGEEKWQTCIKKWEEEQERLEKEKDEPKDTEAEDKRAEGGLEGVEEEPKAGTSINNHDEVDDDNVKSVVNESIDSDEMKSEIKEAIKDVKDEEKSTPMKGDREYSNTNSILLSQDVRDVIECFIFIVKQLLLIIWEIVYGNLYI